MQSGKRADQLRHFAERRESKAAPPGKPKTEIDHLVIAAEQKKENQQYERGGRIEERYFEQSLILQQAVHRPPAGKGRLCSARAPPRPGRGGRKLRLVTHYGSTHRLFL